MLGNVTFLERPFHPTTLISLARSALRGRRRQYEARARLVELHELAEDLEKRVEARTAERERAVEQLHQAQKLETLGQLTGGVAHDFNNLLTPIMGALDSLQRKSSDLDARTARLVSNALQSAERAKTLVQRLLGFARRQTLQTAAIDFADLLDGMHDLIASSVGPSIEVRIRHEADLPLAAVDPNQLELAILNLCVNARDAMPEGGRVTIAAEPALVDPLSELKLAPGLYVRLSVIDTGIGMDAATVARAVEPFFSTKETGRGTGLGLSMIHGLAAQLGGAFSLSSVVGKGTRADIYLPTAKAALARPDRGVPAETAGSIAPLEILLVDDEELVRIGTAEMLRDLGHKVSEADGGAHALELISAGTKVDLLITDYKMPRMDGAQLAARVREQQPDLPVLLITGYTDSPDNIGDLPRLAKPFGQVQLAAALATATGSNANVVHLPLKSRRQQFPVS
jgi:signal transduction histidine kinase/ActR/RegA family two-component response regulator